MVIIKIKKGRLSKNIKDIMPKKSKQKMLHSDDLADDEKEIDGVEDDNEEEDELAAAGMHVEDEEEEEEEF